MTFSLQQIGQVYTLLLRNKSERQIAKVMGLSYQTIKNVIQSNKRRFASRLYQRNKRIEKQNDPKHQEDIRVCQDMIDAIREKVYGFDPLYAVENVSSAKDLVRAKRNWHLRGKIVRAKKDQQHRMNKLSMKRQELVVEEVSILDALLSR